MIKKKLPIQFILVFFISLFPVLIGSALYFARDYIHFKKLNHGVLLKPTIDTSQLSLNICHGKWCVVYVDHGCDETCGKVTHQLEQMRKALGKDSERIQVWSTHSSPAWDAAFKVSQVKFDVINKIYLIDPVGNLMMYYPSTTNPTNIYEDLKRLLEVSQIG